MAYTDNFNVEYPNTPATTIKPLNEDNQNDLAPTHSQTTAQPPSKPAKK